MRTDLIERIDGALIEDAANGVYRCDRTIYTDAELFVLEMEHIFEGNWVYLAHESQIPNKNDYFTTTIGRQPIFIARNRNNELNAFINACAHRGAMLCRHKRANKATFTCSFDGWTFNNSGKLLKVKDPEGAGYPEQFSQAGAHDLKKVAKFGSYRGFLFGSLNPDVKPLVQHLGEAAKMIDMVVDQSPDGLEVLRGSSSYSYDGNWKMQVENGTDGYHISSVHWNYVAITRHRQAAKVDAQKAMDAGDWEKQKGGFYPFEDGHMLLWTRWNDPTNRSVYARLDELAAKFGRARAEWMVNNLARAAHGGVSRSGRAISTAPTSISAIEPALRRASGVAAGRSSG
jgi:benzoate/toluate 1,2-dioxygenase subunit alpha